MKSVKILFLLLSLTLYSCQSKSSLNDVATYKIIVDLENAPFDSLYLSHHTYSDDGVLYKGNKAGKFTWEFTLPDSTIYDYEFMQLLVSPFDSTTNSSKSVRFVTENNGKKGVLANLGIDDRVTMLKGCI